MPSTLWTDRNTGRQFLIPQETEPSLPPGEFVLRSATGRQLRIEAAAVERFLVTPDEARAWLKSQLGQVLQQARDAIGQALRGAPRQPAAQPAVDPRPPGSSTHDADTVRTKWTRFLAVLADESAETLRSDPAAFQRAVERLLRDGASLVADGLSAEPARHAAARQRMLALRALLAEHGIITHPSLENLPDRLRETWVSAHPDEAANATADRLDGLASGLEAATAQVVASLRHQASCLRSPADGPK